MIKNTQKKEIDNRLEAGFDLISGRILSTSLILIISSDRVSFTVTGNHVNAFQQIGELIN